jgi:hypothetical protein
LKIFGEGPWGRARLSGQSDRVAKPGVEISNILTTSTFFSNFSFIVRNMDSEADSSLLAPSIQGGFRYFGIDKDRSIPSANPEAGFELP